jgi:hypothetical protein
MALIM